MNLVFFSSILAVALVSDFFLPPAFYPDVGQNVFEVFYEGNFVLMVFSIFLSNLVLSAFVVVTLPGFVFFPLSTGFLVYRAAIWGFLLHYQPTSMFLLALPTLILEGEAYALAAVAGTVTGASWLMPKRVYSEEGISRVKAFRKGLREFLEIYVFVVLLLFVASVVESVTLVIVR